ncbi:hypothetical protein ALC57_17333 [Trachymyrmex cornetzi]|uniref:Uncharacterized protein n=1 Tax=Trachymyrmex cornetzi TaxID=471704 RepID=A0A195DCW8_9HYME|nr:hypothetical protein ALC57_17333 [Trachymyrmex cornetzi]
MSEAWRFDLAPIRFAAAIANEVNAELALRCLDGGVRRSRWHLETLGEQFEVMDKRLHAALHLLPPRWHNLGVIASYFSLWHLIQALVDDTQRLSHFNPEPRNITPLKPQFSASSAVTVPILIVRCRQILLSVNRSSISSNRAEYLEAQSYMSSIRPNGRSKETPPGRM